MNKNNHIYPFCPFVLLESRKNIGRFEKNISMIEIKHWDISIQSYYKKVKCGRIW